MNILIAYGTTEGQTRKIADVMAKQLRDSGHEVCEIDGAHVSDDFDVLPYDAAILAASVHQWQHQTQIVDFVINKLAWLSSVPTAFISVSLSEAFEDDRAEAQLYIDQFIDETGWTPDVTLSAAGALQYRKYDFMRRWAMRLVADAKGAPTDMEQDHEYTDWAAIAAFVDQFVREVATRKNVA